MRNECEYCEYYYREDFELSKTCHCEPDIDPPLHRLPCEHYDDSYELQHDKQRGLIWNYQKEKKPSARNTANMMSPLNLIAVMTAPSRFQNLSYVKACWKKKIGGAWLNTLTVINLLS